MAGKTDCKVSVGRKVIGLTEARSMAPFASDRRGGGRYECMANRLETAGAGKTHQRSIRQTVCEHSLKHGPTSAVARTGIGIGSTRRIERDPTSYPI